MPGGKLKYPDLAKCQHKHYLAIEERFMWVRCKDCGKEMYIGGKR